MSHVKIPTGILLLVAGMYIGEKLGASGLTTEDILIQYLKSKEGKDGTKKRK